MRLVQSTVMKEERLGPPKLYRLVCPAAPGCASWMGSMMHYNSIESTIQFIVS